MNIVTDKTGTIEGFRSILEEISMDEHTRGIMILACDGNDFTPELIDDLLKKLKKPLFGGVFPAIIHDREKMDRRTQSSPDYLKNQQYIPSLTSVIDRTTLMI